MTPLLITGLTIAPVPVPVDVIVISGNELYCSPWFTTITSSIFPLAIIAFNSADFPFSIDIFGFTWWFNILEPYSVPPSYK